MIAICDSEISDRAKALRKKLFSEGYPCAAVCPSEIHDCLPVKLIIAYYAVFDEIRHGPYDDIFAIVIGSGFVNSALNAIRVDTEEEACRMARDYLMNLYSIDERRCFPFGVLADPAVFLAKKHFEIFGNIVEVTVSEYMIFKYLLAHASQKYYFSPEKIRKFCYIRELHGNGNLDGNISVHISNLNSKIENACGRTIIRSRRYYGYYLDMSRL